jgi:hypothetical protein
MSGFRKDEPYFVPVRRFPYRAMVEVLRWAAMKLNVASQTQEAVKDKIVVLVLYRLLPYFVPGPGYPRWNLFY